MNFLTIIILFFIVNAIIKIVKAKNEQGEGNRTYRELPKDPYQQPYAELPTQTSVSNTAGNVTIAAGHIGIKPVKLVPDLSRVAEPVKEKKEQSTVDYLSEKAEKEQQSQDLESRNAARSKQTLVNGIRMAERVIEGNTVPADRKVIHCNYCGADNMISGHSHEKYTCYFCREII